MIYACVRIQAPSEPIHASLVQINLKHGRQVEKSDATGMGVKFQDYVGKAKITMKKETHRQCTPSQRAEFSLPERADCSDLSYSGSSRFPSCKLRI